MNIFELSLEEIEIEMNKVLYSKSTEELLKEFQECGLELEKQDGVWFENRFKVFGEITTDEKYAFIEMAEDLARLYEEYTNTPDEELTESAIKLKRELIEWKKQLK